MRAGIIAAALLAAVFFAIGQVDVRLVSHIYQPAELDPADARVAQLRLPPGFQVRKFAEGLGNPRILAVAADGTVYVTRRQEGDVVMLRDSGNGRAGAPRVVARHPGMHGIAIHGNRVYLAAIREVFYADRRPDGSLGPLTAIIKDLPDGGQHPNRTLAVGPDKMLYITVGSTCNACDEPNPEHATILRADLNGQNREIFARGLRNTLGFGWHPQTGELWSMDHGIDWLGDDEQKEELNRLVRGAHYGWPVVYEMGRINPRQDPTRVNKARYTSPTLLYTAHAAPMQMVFYTGAQFPAEYRNDAFVAMRGSWNARPPVGYEVARVRFRSGRPVSVEPFLTGFLVQQGPDRWGHFGRPAGIALTLDGALLVSDDTRGVLYRVSYGDTPVTRR